jgi:hypothetical protein
MSKKSKKIKISCNICFEKQADSKCSKCTYICCYECIYTWSERSLKCPQCGQFQSYDIEYPEIEEKEEESITDFDLYNPDYTNQLESASESASESIEHDYPDEPIFDESGEFGDYIPFLTQQQHISNFEFDFNSIDSEIYFPLLSLSQIALLLHMIPPPPPPPPPSPSSLI